MRRVVGHDDGAGTRLRHSRPIKLPVSGLSFPGDVLAVMGPGSADAAASDLTLSVAVTQT